MRVSHSKRIAIGAAALILVAVVGIVVGVEAGVPMGGLTHSQAVALARQQVDREPTVERWSVPGPFLLFRGGSTDAVSPWRRMVWAVSLRGTFPPPSCGPLRTTDEPVRCPPPGHTVTVILDYSTGEFIQADYGP